MQVRGECGFVALSDSAQEMELLARMISQSHRAMVQAELTAAGLGEIGHPMLLTIMDSYQDQEGECRCSAQRDLAQLLHISPAAVANSLKSLERGGYIRRMPGTDARRNQVLLTEKGKQAVVECRLAFTHASKCMLSGFSEEEIDLLMSFRRRMLENLCDGDKKFHRKEET